MSMTRKEAIEALSLLKIFDAPRLTEAMHIAIEALKGSESDLLLIIDEDMALALCAGANAIQLMHPWPALYQHGSEDQRAIPYYDAARALLAAGEARLKRS